MLSANFRSDAQQNDNENKFAYIIYICLDVFFYIYQRESKCERKYKNEYKCVLKSTNRYRKKKKLGKNLSFNLATLIKILVFKPATPTADAASQMEINFLSLRSNCNRQKIKVSGFFSGEAIVGKNYVLNLMFIFQYFSGC